MTVEQLREAIRAGPARRGKTSTAGEHLEGTGGAFTYAATSTDYTPSQAWKTSTGGEHLDMLGNWKVLVTDADADGPDANGTDTKECRNHNQANELSSQDLDCNPAALLDHTFDAAGNMRTQKVGTEASPTTITYTHDLWNRLLEVKYGSDVRAKYVYNGLNWRILKQADTNPETSIGLDEERRMFYSAEWQLVEERIDIESPFDGGTDIDKHMQYVWGIRYIDDIALRRLDADKNGSYTDTNDKIYYHCTDVMFSTVCVLNSTDAKTLERVSYDAYGKARHHRAADMNADGRVNNSDYLVVVGGWGSFPNQGDVNRDGLVNASDSNAVVADWGSGLAPGKLSTTDNVIGWDGYVFNAELGEGGLYTVRHRPYRPELGRWLRHDPLNQSYEANLFVIDFGNPINVIDPDGLAPYCLSTLGPCSTLPGLIPPCPSTAPTQAVGDGWCLDSSFPHCKDLGLTCYRSYGTGTQGGQQCCYALNGQLVDEAWVCANAPGRWDCIGSIDRSGPATGEDSSGLCKMTLPSMWRHGEADVLGCIDPKNRCDCLNMECCLRAYGVPSGTSQHPFGPYRYPGGISDADLTRAFNHCVEHLDELAPGGETCCFFAPMVCRCPGQWRPPLP